MKTFTLAVKFIFKLLLLTVFQSTNPAILKVFRSGNEILKMVLPFFTLNGTITIDFIKIPLKATQLPTECKQYINSS